MITYRKIIITGSILFLCCEIWILKSQSLVSERDLANNKSLFVQTQNTTNHSLKKAKKSPSFAVYSNPVIPGDHSDCTLTQIGDDFYTTGSSFNPTPVIYHSTDLVHWEAIAQPVSAAWDQYGDAPQGGCWGGQVVYYNNKFWFFFCHNGMQFTTAEKIEGPWSMPTKVNDPPQLPYTLGYDNSIFIDDNGKWYMIVKNGQPNNGIVELGNDGQPTGTVYNLNWLNPAPFPYSWAEGPVMWKHNGYYYYSFARDVSGGQKVMHSKSLTAEKSAWTVPVDLFNESDPAKANALFFGPNHSSAAVMLADSTSWVIHPVWARANNNEWFGQGRQGLLNELHYDKANNVVADYPVNRQFSAPKLPGSGIPWMVPKSDFFGSEVLNPEWSFLGYTPTNSWSLTERPGWIRLKPKSEKPTNTIIKTDAEHNYSLITRVDFNPQKSTDEAGLRIMNGKENLFARVFSTLNSGNEKTLCFSFDSTLFETENTVGNIVWLKITRVNHILKGYFSADGIEWTQIGNEIDVTNLDKYERDYNGWCGNRQGLYVKGSSADFDLYIYRDAYAPILAECPANQNGTSRIQIKGKDFGLGNIHNNDWALFAGVEFGSTDYQMTSDSIKLTIASLSDGTVEVWLDSIGTGKKIADCRFRNTGNMESFKTFKTKTIRTEGRHDVYLRFLLPADNASVLLNNFVFIPFYTISMQEKQNSTKPDTQK
jgi:xylan 1,4-beta-xylosidase